MDPPTQREFKVRKHTKKPFFPILIFFQGKPQYLLPTVFTVINFRCIVEKLEVSEAFKSGFMINKP